MLTTPFNTNREVNENKLEYELAKLDADNNIIAVAHTPDENPLRTIKDIKEITENIKNGVMPNKFLTVDMHIIEYSKLEELILNVPNVLEFSKLYGKIPFIPIHPLSYRKEWQYDDETYNIANDGQKRRMQADVMKNFESKIDLWRELENSKLNLIGIQNMDMELK